MLVRRGIKDSIARLGLDEDIVTDLLEDLTACGITILENTSTTSFTLPTDPTDHQQKVTIALKGEVSQIECDVYSKSPSQSTVACDSDVGVC